MNKFAIDNMKIKSSWFDGKRKSVYHKMGKEEGLNLFLQLFRFRQHQGDYNKHIFRVTISELKQFTKVNANRKLTFKQVVDLLKKFEKLGIVKNHSFQNWNAIYDHNDDVIADKLIVLEATDVPNTIREADDNGKVTDRPVGDDDYYIPINFNMVNHIYDNASLGSHELCLYYLIRKLSGKYDYAYLNINTMKDYLGIGNDRATLMLQHLNKSRLIATMVKRKNGGVDFEHIPCLSVELLERFDKNYSSVIDKYLARYKDDESVIKVEEIEIEDQLESIVEVVDDNDINEWGDVSSSYEEADEWLKELVI